MRSLKPRGLLKVGPDPPHPSLNYTAGVNRMIDSPLTRNIDSKSVVSLRSPQIPKFENAVQSLHVTCARGGFTKQRTHYSKPASSVEADIVGTSSLNCQSLPKQESPTASSKSCTFKLGGFTKQRTHYSKPASSVEADIVGTSSLNCHSLPKQESPTASSKSYTFKEGNPPKKTKHFHQGSSSSAPAQKIVFCNICMTSKPFTMFFAIEGCKHSYCSGCLGSYIESKINANMTMIKCPDAACKDGKLEPLACKSMITKKAFDHWCDALCESTVGERFYCLFKDCSALLLDERGQEVMQESECPHCHRLFCAHCRVPWHTGQSCGKFQEMSQLGKDKKQESMLLELAKKSRWQRCPKCMFYVEKVSGCMFIKCRCGAKFCYGCASVMEVDHYCAKCKR